METFGERLHARHATRGALCVGIDPHASLLDAWGLDDDPAGLERFAMTCVEAFAADIAVLKPQSAFFERMGSAGIAVLEKVVAGSRAAGALVLLDAKRGDLDSTMQGYAEAYLQESSPVAVDAMTVNPYLGFESLRPVLDTASANGRGVFVLALTSNPEGPQFQSAATTIRRRWPERCWRPYAPRTLGSLRWARSGRSSEPPCRAWTRTSRSAGRCSRPGYGVQGGSAEHIRNAVRQLLRPSAAVDLAGRADGRTVGAGPAGRGGRCLDELAGDPPDADAVWNLGRVSSDRATTSA